MVIYLENIFWFILKTSFDWQGIIKSAFKLFLFCSYHPSRVFINNQKTRNLLLKYAQKGISRTEFQTLRQLLSLYQTSMDPLMTALEETGFNNKAPDYIAPFIKYLACNYPVCGWLHYDAYLFDILTSISEGTNIDEQEFVHLNEVTPILASMVRRMDTNILRPILLELIRKTKVPFSRGNPHDLPMTEKEDVCGYFPTLPKFCDRGSYVLDDKKSKLQDGKCEKKTGRHPSLTPGIFTLSCKHGNTTSNIIQFTWYKKDPYGLKSIEWQIRMGPKPTL